MGLLDILNSRDGVFALGLLDAAAAKPVRTSFGGGLLSAMGQADAWQQQQEARRQQQAERLLKAQLMGAQLQHLGAQTDETRAQAKQREQQAAEAVRKAALTEQTAKDQGAFLANPFVQAPTGAPSFMSGSGQRSPEANATAAAGATRPQFDYATAARLFGPEHAAKLMQGLNDARNFGLDKVAGQVETTMPGTNMPGTMLRDEFGRPVGQVLPKAVEMKLMDLGGSLRATNPFALQAGQGFDKTVSPDTTYTGGITMRGQNMVDARSREANTISAGNRATDAETALRKEFETLPEVKSYKQAFPSYSGILDASKRSTPMADINMVYGLAKLYDPNSVVREGEYATVANSPNIPERVKGWAQYLSGGGKLTEQVKRQIVAEAQGRIRSYEAEAAKARDSFSGIVKRNGLNPDNVFTSFGNIGASPGVVDFSNLGGGTPGRLDWNNLPRGR